MTGRLISIIPAKLAIPPVPAAYVPRDRLDRIWNGWSTKRLVLVTAGAGFGKTQFLAANARRSGRPAVWYALDEMDADLATFGVHLCHALGCLEPGTGAVPSASAAPDELLARLARGLRENDRGTVIVLDDYHLIDGAPGIDRFLEQLIRYLPPGSTLVLASRHPPGLATMKLRSLGDVGEVQAADLRFNETETAALFRRRFGGAEIDLELLRRLVALTEGWAAGLAIFFEVLESPARHHVERAIDSMTAAGSGWFAYFAEEVVSRLDDETRRFLLRSSVLPRLDPGLCDRVLGGDRSRAILEALCDRNLFTFRAEEGGEVYRYHRLFREFLRDRFGKSEGEEGARRARREAAAALEKAGDPAAAVALWADAGCHDDALRLVEKFGEDLLAAGQFEVIRRALAGIPARLLDERPATLLVLGRATEIPGRGEEAEAIYRRALRRSEPGPLRVELMALIAQNLQRRGEHRKCITLCRKALAEPGRIPPRSRGRVLNMLGISACELGRLDEAEGYLDQATRLLRRSGERDIRTFYLLPGNIHYRRGDFPRAKEAARRALLEFKKRKDRRAFCHSLGVLAYVTAEAAETRESRALATEALRLAETLEYPVMQGYGHLAIARCDRLEGDLAGAREHLAAAARIGEIVGETGLRTVPPGRLAELALAEEDRARAARLGKAALEAAESFGDIYEEARACLFLGRLRAATRPKEAERWWSRAEKIMRRVGMSYELHRLLLVRLASEREDGDDAQRSLAELLGGAAALGHDFLFLSVEREAAMPVLARAVRDNVEAEYAGGLLGSFGEAAVPHLTPLVADPSEEARSRAVHLLTLIGGEAARRALVQAADDRTPSGRAAEAAARELDLVPARPLGVHALGPLIVEAGGRRIELAHWKSARALRLFQLLLVHRFRWVARESLIEALWPETEPSKGANNLRQTIHLLRRVLESEKEDGGARYIRVHNEACRLEAGPDARYDVEDFESRIESGDAAWRAGNRSAAAPLLRHAVEIYRGPFLAESPYEEFAADERERLRSLFHRALGRLLTHGAEEERWDEVAAFARRGLAEDPYEEEFHYRLAQAHDRLGHKQEALAAYHRYEEIMIRELDLLPSERMKRLADEITSIGS